jgi:LmbE family N-acetylglucosaminyl deacetylase
MAALCRRFTRVVALSPHLDDAVLSLGAVLHALSERSVDVRVLTVLANDPDTRGDPAPWDAMCGFRSAGEAALGRRVEDEQACRIIGARPSWLPYGDETYCRGAGDDEIWGRIVAAVDGADAVFVPGFPLVMPDHAWLHRLVMARRASLECRLFLYAEQPYAAGAHMREFQSSPRRALADHHVSRAQASERDGDPASPTARWKRVRTSVRDRAAKTRAIASYRSQLRPLGPFVLVASQIEEICWGGELVGTLAEGQPEAQSSRRRVRRA